MKKIKLELDYLDGPICGDIYSVEQHRSITGIKIIDDDRILQELQEQIQDLFLTYFEFCNSEQPCRFNKDKQKADKNTMLTLIAKLKSRLIKINDGTFEIEDLITPEYENLW